MTAIYEPKGKAREYSPLALNYYKGCSHNCKYCYVTPMFKRFNKNYNHLKVELTKETSVILKEVEKSAKKFQNSEKQVLLCFTSDPYNNMETIQELTKNILQILLKYNIPVSVLSKGGKRILRDIALFKKFKENIIIGQTITFEKKENSLYWESGASLPAERLEVFKTLRENNIKTWASFEPVIIPEQSLGMLKNIAKNNLCNFVKIGKLNNYKGLDKNIDWNDFLNKAVRTCRDYNLPFYIKKDLLKFKDNNLYLSKNEIDEDFFALKNKNVLINNLFDN